MLAMLAIPVVSAAATRLESSPDFLKEDLVGIMYQDIEHRKDDDFITRIVCDSILTLPLHPFMKKEEQDKVINTILLLI